MTKTAKHHHRKHGKIRISQVILIVLILLLGLLIALLLLTGRVKVPSSLRLTAPDTEIPPGLVQAPTPYLLLPQGRQSYLIRSGSANEPIGTRIVVDPLDARRGEQQRVDLDLEYREPVDSVSVLLITDNAEQSHQMSITSGDATKGTWSSTHVIGDDHEQIYEMRFTINYAGRIATIDFPIR